ncbi:hypothetical protein, partial [Ruegeria arenilitoris]|uniref:hypothetical protein n=1 Tax=Ruegeria arenilitoris TaxID=1173585 RepID=UPI001C2BD095
SPKDKGAVPQKVLVKYIREVIPSNYLDQYRAPKASEHLVDRLDPSCVLSALVSDNLARHSGCLERGLSEPRSKRQSGTETATEPHAMP